MSARVQTAVPLILKKTPTSGEVDGSLSSTDCIDQTSARVQAGNLYIDVPVYFSSGSVSHTNVEL